METFEEKWPELIIYQEAQFNPIGFTPDISDILEDEDYESDDTFWGLDTEAVRKKLELKHNKPYEAVRCDPEGVDQICWFFYPKGTYKITQTLASETVEFLRQEYIRDKEEFDRCMDEWVRTEEGKQWLEDALNALKNCVERNRPH